MPLHRFYIPVGFYSKEDKAAVVKAVQQCYAHLPKFYVVIFTEVDKENFYVGAEATDNFVRVVVHHMAAHYSDEYKKVFMDKYEKALEPFIKARGADWEIQVAEMDRCSISISCSRVFSGARVHDPVITAELLNEHDDSKTTYSFMQRSIESALELYANCRSPINFNDASFLEHWSKEGSGRWTTIDSVGSTRTL